MSIAVLGAGAMARYVLAEATEKGLPVTAQIVRPGKIHPEAALPQVAAVADLPRGTRLLVECAGHGGLAEHAPEALRRGIDVLCVSMGALADAELHARLEQAARDGGATLQLASGAIGALDVLRAASAGGIDHVTYRGRKPPAGWLGSPAEDRLDFSKPLAGPATHFTGTAREAALAYPKNANVAAAVALAGLGLDATDVELIADPDATGNTHEIETSGAFGEVRFAITGKGLPDNPRTSALAAMSVVSALLERDAPIRF